MLCVKNICFHTAIFTSHLLNAIHVPGMVPGTEDITVITAFLAFQELKVN